MASHALLGLEAEIPVHVELPTLVAEEIPARAIAAMRAGMRIQGGQRGIAPSNKTELPAPTAPKLTSISGTPMRQGH